MSPVTDTRTVGIATVRSMNLLVLIPAYNEELSIGPLLDELRGVLPDAAVLVVSDGSVDATAAVARSKGAKVLALPCNLGVGGAVQAGFRYALEQGYSHVVRIDGDGQHPPAEIPKLIARMQADAVDLVVGSRFGATDGIISTRLRYAGIRGLAWFLGLICRARVEDPTSGFWMLSRKLLYYFAHSYPSDYPEPEALALMRRQGYAFAQVPVTFRRRTTGRSSISGWGTFYYVLKVGLALVVDRVRPVDERFHEQRARLMT